MRRLFGCPDIVSLTEKFLMARDFYRIFTENNPVMEDSKTFGITEAKGLMPIVKGVYLISENKVMSCSNMKTRIVLQKKLTRVLIEDAF